jgi:hypothetical protein
MKKIKLFSLLVLLCTAAFAQYKKASFFNKDGRTIEIGTGLSFIPNGGKPALSFTYTTSIESQKNLSPYNELEFMTKPDFSYTGSYFVPGTGTVEQKINGKGPSYLMVKYGIQYRFVKVEGGDDAKLVPYIKLGIGFGAGLSSKYTVKASDGSSLNDLYVEPTIPDHELFFVAEPGAGVTYFFTKKIGLKIGASYLKAFQLGGGDDQSTFYPLQSHPRISMSVKFRIFSED